MKRLMLALVLATSLATAAGAAGYTVAQSVDVRPGGSAVFLPQHWFCQNHGRRVACQSGDAYPWAELTGTRNGGVTVRVHTASGGGVGVRVVRHPAVPGGPPSNEIILTRLGREI